MELENIILSEVSQAQKAQNFMFVLICRLYFKATEANRRRRLGTREKVSLRKINLEGNTHVQEINVNQLPS
jgi:hypothetical protein